VKRFWGALFHAKWSCARVEGGRARTIGRTQYELYLQEQHCSRDFMATRLRHRKAAIILDIEAEEEGWSRWDSNECVAARYSF